MQSFLLIHYFDILLLLSLVALFIKPKVGRETYLIWGAVIGAAVSLVSKYVIPALRRRKYTPGEYEAGAMYRRMVLGENFPNTDNDLKVGNEATHLAMLLFTAGFGVLCTKRSYYYMIYRGEYDAYVKKLKEDEPLYKFTREQFERAQILAQLYFVDQVAPPTKLWDLNNFDKLPYLGPIPDPDNPKIPLTTELPGGIFLKNGYFVNPTASEAAAIKIADGTMTVAQAQAAGVKVLEQDLAATTGTGATANKSIYLYLAAGAAALYFISRKKRA